MTKTTKIKLTTTKMVEIPIEKISEIFPTFQVEDFVKHCKKIIRKNISAYFNYEKDKNFPYPVWRIATDLSFFTDPKDYAGNCKTCLFAWNKYCEQFFETMEYRNNYIDENPFSENGDFISHMVGVGIYTIIMDIFYKDKDDEDIEIELNEDNMLDIFEKLEDIKEVNLKDWM